MHTLITASGRRFHHNGDFSGEVIMSAAPDEVTPNDAERKPGFAVTVPFADLLDLLDEYLRMRAEELG